MEFSVLLSTIVLMAILMFTGFMIARTVDLTTEVRRLMIIIIINIALPCIILHGIFQLEVDAELFNQVMIIFLCAVSICVFGVLFSYGAAKCFKKAKNKEPEISFLGGLGNTGIIGIPICAALFGAKGALFGAVFDTGMCLTLWTLGVFILNRDKKFSLKTLKSVVSPPLLAAVSGLVLVSLNIRPVGIAFQVIESFAYLTAPMGMMYVGMLIYTMISKRNFVSFGLLSIPLVIKLLILPILVILVLSQISMQETTKMVILIQATMPSVTTASIILARYGRDENFAALTTLVSVLISLVTIPILVIIGRMMIF